MTVLYGSEKMTMRWGTILALITAVSCAVAAHYTSKIESKAYTDMKIEKNEDTFHAVVEDIKKDIHDIQLKQAVQTQILIERFGMPKRILPELPPNMPDHPVWGDK